MINSEKILSSISILIVSVFLIYISFFSNNKEYNWNKITFSWLVEDSSSIWSGVFLEKINSFDEIYSNNKNSYKIISNGNNIKINLKEGIFVINTYDITKKYEIIYDWFIIKLDSLGKVFINTNELKKPLILSLDSIFQLNLVNDKSEILTKTYIFPHQYIKFDFTKDLWLRDTDSFRITQLYANWYIKDSLFKDNKILVKLSALFSLDDKQSIVFLDIIFKKILVDIQKSDLEYEKSLKSVKEFEYIPDESIWSNILINKKKESLDCKNKVLSELKSLFKEEELWDDWINSIVKDLDKLKKINIKDYKNILDQINRYSNIVNLSKDSKIESKNNFNKILLNISKINYKYNKSYVIIKDLYKNYDYWFLDSFDVSFWIFLNEYIIDNDLNRLNKSNIWNDLSSVDSFLLFFSKIIKSNLLSSDINLNIDWIINIINKYFWISSSYYFNDNIKLPENVINTWIYQNLEIINLVDKFILDSFFEKKDILVLKKVKFNNEYINKLNSNLNNLLNLIYDKKTDFLLEADYDILLEKFNKYFSIILE